ncbi:uncharacterized protein LOC141885700 isoform X2 [Acropora palmata]|uniref:uncharacterized protein LOC141885700 isoform X2 n=1 Tax=Acropora palmata TaxID=6131 RepID=UPI003DA10AA1
METGCHPYFLHLRRSFLVFITSKMPPRHCVGQYCSRVSNKELSISMHTSPSSGNSRTKWKRFVSQHRKDFNPTGPFGICSLHFETACFTRAVYVKGTERRIKQGSVELELEGSITSPQRLISRQHWHSSALIVKATERLEQKQLIPKKIN